MAHRCNKEVEIAEMHSDIKQIRKLLEGNGVEGLVRTVSKNSEHRIEAQTTGKLVKLAVGSGWLTTIIIALLTYVH